MSSHPIRKTKPSTIKARSRNKKIAIVGLVAIVVVVVSVAFVMLSQGSSPDTVNPSPTPTPAPSPTPNIAYPTAPPVTSPAGEYSATGHQVLLETSVGNITIQLRDDKPITTQNFINLVNQGLYDGTIFHRVIAGFMIQGGQNTTVDVAKIKDEIGNDNHNYIGTIAMAKTVDPNSATSEFFINVANNNQITYQDGTSFDGTYTVFGQVISGMNVVNAIANAQVTTNPVGENSQPVQPVTVLKAVVIA